jgi:tryptophan 2-monooxygenase
MSEETRRAAAQEFATFGGIRTISHLLNVEEFNPTTYPDNPFDFIGLVDRPQEFFPVVGPGGIEVAVIGAGNAGVAAGNLLMRMGLKPVIYDITGRVGGRSYTLPFDSDPKALAEMGSMRIPLAQKLVFHLLDRWGIGYKQFQNPLVVDTVIDVNGQQVFYDAATGKYEGPPEMVASIQVVADKYSAIINPIVDAWNATAGDFPARMALWQSYVAEYNNKSLYQMLIENSWTTDQINLFGYIGIGSGGFDSFFPSSFLEIVRIEIQELEKKGTQQLIIGGTNQIPMKFWTEEVECLHWGKTSLEALTGGLRPGVRQIRTAPPGQQGTVSITDTEGVTNEYAAAILTASPRAVDMTMAINQDAFSVNVWTALRNLEITSSEKVFILTKTPFWNTSSEFKLYTTLTDQPPRQMYTFDNSDWGTDTPHGAVLLSYSWASSAIRYNALDEEERIQVCLNAIENMAIYGKPMREKLEAERIDSRSICWEDEYGYSGGYRMANPGQAQQVSAMHAQSLGQPSQWNNGLYLAGEALSWYGLSGWIDGAIKTGLQAAISAILRAWELPAVPSS